MPQFTQALWCDFGDHDFSSRDPKKKVLSIMGEDDFGNEVEENWTACGKHVPAGPANSRIVRGVLDEPE